MRQNALFMGIILSFSHIFCIETSHLLLVAASTSRAIENTATVAFDGGLQQLKDKLHENNRELRSARRELTCGALVMAGSLAMVGTGAYYCSVMSSMPLYIDSPDKSSYNDILTKSICLTVSGILGSYLSLRSCLCTGRYRLASHLRDDLKKDIQKLENLA